MSSDRGAVVGAGDRGATLLRLAGLLAIVFVLTTAATVPVGAASPDGTAAPTDDSPLAQMDVEADTVTLRATLDDDGTATWRVAYRVELDDENASAAFEDLRADVQADPAPYRQRFEDRMARTVRGAENVTGREMAVENVSVSATRESLPQGEYGVLVYRLDWHGFAAVEGDRLRAGDAIDQFFLSDRQSLSVAWPDEYELVSADPDGTTVDEGSVTWQGRFDFGPGEPRVVVARGDTTGGDAGSGDTAGGDATGLPLALVGGGLVLLAALFGVGGWLYTRTGRESSGARRGGEATGPVGPAGGDGEEETATDSGTTDGPPPELLSNEERLLALLAEHGGRMKQQQVAERLDWTDAKTSQVVGDLREADELESFRLGRENVLTLPDVSVEPDDAEGRG